MFITICIALSHPGFAQVHIYVHAQPVAPVIVRPAPPTPDHIWVEHEWIVRNGEYVHVPGYWAVPPRERARWVPGHWKRHHRHGYYWMPGHWAY